MIDPTIDDDDDFNDTLPAPQTCSMEDGCESCQ